ncbi:MAG: hypothetical protein C4570_06625 [Ammonifex sp.]|jgi:hypothetical protein|nr:MAG: hypothetical protein C4570_06625 [Ammonifex sp.]
MGTITIDHLLLIASFLGARVTYSDLHAIHPKLEAYTRFPAIHLDKSLECRPRQHRCVLAEEIGHVCYPPRPGHVAYHVAGSWNSLDYEARDGLAVIVAQDERKALKWATGLLIPNSAFWRFAGKGPQSMEDWLEEFDVERWFLEAKIGLIRVSQPPRQRLQWRNLIKRSM